MLRVCPGSTHFLFSKRVAYHGAAEVIALFGWVVSRGGDFRGENGDASAEQTKLIVLIEIIPPSHGSARFRWSHGYSGSKGLNN